MNKLWILFFVCFQARAAIEPIKLFGVQFNLRSSKNNEEKLRSYVMDNAKLWSATFDPDCFYKSYGNKDCGVNVDKKLLKEIETISAEAKRETKDFFNVEVVAGKKKQRDFGGIAQGFVLEKMKQKFPTDWLGDFTGDVYVAPGSQNITQALYVSDTLADTIPYAIVEMKEGWMLSSSSPTMGGIIRGEDKSLSTPQKIKRITLFAAPQFNGARLDAWTTAVIAGGVPLLKHLYENAKFKAQWAYLFFDYSDKPVCSSNITCDFADAGKRQVKIDWSQK